LPLSLAHSCRIGEPSAMIPNHPSFRASSRTALLAAAGLMIAACGGEEDTSSAAAATDGSRPVAETRAGAAKPAAADPNALPAPKCPAKTDKGLPGPDIL